MGEHVHFLERLSRVDEAQTRRALRLYNDHQLVKRLLTLVELPPSADRLAVPLDEGDDPPHVILARDGHFVTCLAAGMTTGRAPVLPWPQVEGALREQRAKSVLTGLDGDDLAAIFRRAYLGGADVSREEFAPVALLAPLLRKSSAKTWLDVYLPLFPRIGRVQAQHAKGRATDDELQRLWLHRWELAHRGAALLASDPGGTWMRSAGHLDAITTVFLDVDGACGGFMPTAARTVWAMGQLGADRLGQLRQQRAQAILPGHAAIATLSLGVLALRFPELMDEVRALLARPVAREPVRVPMTWAHAERTDALVLELLAAPRASWDAFLGNAARWAMRELETRFGAEAASFAVEDLLALALSKAKPSEDPGAWAHGLVGFLPALAKASVLDLYLPRRWLVGSRYERAWAETLVERSFWLAKEPVRAAPKAERNGPCPCGSGKKAKRCCAAVA